MFTKCLGGSFNLYKEQAFELTRKRQWNAVTMDLLSVEGTRIL